MGYVVAISGTHGTGKTTSVFDLARQLKITYPKKTIIPLTEQAALSPYPINKEATKKSQMWIFVSQIARELELLSRFDIVVSDRSAVDSIAYARFCGFDELADDMVSMVRHHMPVYKQIHFKFRLENEFWFPDGLRDSDDRDFREKIERILLDIYQELGFFFSRTSSKCLPGAGLCETGFSIYPGGIHHGLENTSI